LRLNIKKLISYFCDRSKYQVIISNLLSTINGIEITSRTKRFSNALKKKMVNMPMSKIIIPPISSHLKDTKTATSKIIQGKVLGKLLTIPFTPPPKDSAPDKREKTKSRTARNNKTILAMSRITFAVL
jgi:hypothetical protein